MSVTKIATVVDRATYQVARAVGVVALLGFLTHICADVAMRTFTGHGWRSTLDFTAFWYMPACVFAGFVIAEHVREHMEVDLVTARLTRGSQNALQPLVFIATVVFAAILSWYGLEGAIEDMELGKSGVISGLPLWPLRFMIPIGAFLLIVQVICSHILGRTKPHE